MNKNGEGGVFFIDGFVNSINKFLLAAKTTRCAKKVGPRECHGIDKSGSTMLEGSTGTGIKKKIFSGGANDGKKIIGEVVGFFLWKEILVNGVAGEAMEMFVGETNVDALKLVVFGRFHGVCWKRNL